MTRHPSRRTALALSTALALGLALPAAAQTRWDMPTPYGDTVFHTMNIAQFADDVRAATDGALDITVHSAGSLFGHPEIKDSVRRGLAPIGEILMSRLANEDPIFEVDSIPFLAASYDEAEALWAASRGAVEDLMSAQGLTLLFAVPWPGQSLFLREAVEDPADLRGKTFRAYNAATERMAELLGMIPTQVEAGDIPTAFATGRVESMITSPSTGVSSQAWDFTSHYIDVQAWLPKNMVFVNTRALQALPEAQRAALMEAAAAAEARGWEMSQAETATQIAALEAAGMTVSSPTEAMQAALEEVGATMTAEWLAAAGAAGEAVIGAFRGE
jgi:TRAP-type C4-dicarboxylate transport system substrate-binding protein